MVKAIKQKYYLLYSSKAESKHSPIVLKLEDGRKVFHIDISERFRDIDNFKRIDNSTYQITANNYFSEPICVSLDEESGLKLITNKVVAHKGVKEIKRRVYLEEIDYKDVRKMQVKERRKEKLIQKLGELDDWSMW